MPSHDPASGAPALSQLPLGLRLDAHARFTTFCADGNEALVEHLRSAAAGGRRETVWVAGPEQSGKTHLLQAACRSAGQAGLRAIYLAAGGGLPPASLEGLDTLDFVAIDDIAAIAGDPENERSLFAVVDAFYRGAGVFVAAAGVTPAAAGFRLPDLASRLAGSIVYRVQPLPEAARAGAFVELAALRGIEIDAPTAQYLLSRIRRDMRALTEWVDVLDRESLAAQRRVTLPFVRELLVRRGGAEPPGEP